MQEHERLRTRRLGSVASHWLPAMTGYRPGIASSRGWHYNRMNPTGAHRILDRDGELLSWVTIANMGEDQAAPAIVRFLPQDGVSVKLLDAPRGWPTQLGGRGDLIVHGATVEGRHPFTILHARITRVELGDRPRALHATTLALGAHLDHETKWSSAAYGTAHLHEWLGDTGLRITDWDVDESGQTRRLAHEWTPPETHVVDLVDARLMIGPVMETQVAFSAEQRVVTDTQLGVRPAEPLTVAQLERRYARPLLAFSTLAADRPDAIIHESVSDAKRKEHAVILRAGRVERPRPWEPDARFLFRAEQIDDVARIYGRWMALWREASAEIATFVDALSEGNTFSRPRLLAGVAALEAYWRTRLSIDEHGAKRKGTGLFEKLKMLRTHAGVDPRVIGATNTNLKMLVAARNLYAHLSQVVVELPEGAIDDRLVENCRIAAALLQACLLRDLDVPPPDIAGMFKEHLASWPLA